MRQVLSGDGREGVRRQRNNRAAARCITISKIHTAIAKIAVAPLGKNP
jgi:hypothetical protein